MISMNKQMNEIATYPASRPMFPAYDGGVARGPRNNRARRRTHASWLLASLHGSSST